MDKEQALSATKTGAISACIVAFVTLAITFFAIWNNSSGTLGFYNNPTVFFDVVVTSILAYGMYRKSLTAAVMMFLFFLLAKIYTMETERPAGIVTGLIFLYIFGKAMQGAYVLKKIEKAESPGYPTKSNWMKFFIITGVVLFFSLAGVGILTTTGTLTPTEVLEGKDLSKDYREALIRSDIINSGDSIQYFYSEAFSSIEETGSILTSDRVIMYLQDENKETAVYELYFEDITDVELTESGNFLNDSVYKVYADSRDAYLTIVLSTTDRGDIKFIEALRSELEPYR
jgi:hypothetical protein